MPSKKTYSALLFSSSRGGLLLSSENGESSSFPPLVENPPHSLRLWRILQKRSSVGIPFQGEIIT